MKPTKNNFTVIDWIWKCGNYNCNNTKIYRDRPLVCPACQKACWVLVDPYLPIKF